jgi:hypothetical protein
LQVSLGEAKYVSVYATRRSIMVMSIFNVCKLENRWRMYIGGGALPTKLSRKFEALSQK